MDSHDGEPLFTSPTATLLRDGNVLTIGGSASLASGDPELRTEIYDHSTQTWSFTGGHPLSFERNHHATTEKIRTSRLAFCRGHQAAQQCLQSAENLARRLSCFVYLCNWTFVLSFANFAANASAISRSEKHQRIYRAPSLYRLAKVENHRYPRRNGQERQDMLQVTRFLVFIMSDLHSVCLP